MIELSHYLFFSALLFGLGVAGVLVNHRNLIIMLMSIELILLSVNTNFVAFSHYVGNYTGQIFVFFVLTVAAAEAAIGLAIMVLIYRRNRSIHVDQLNALKG